MTNITLAPIPKPANLEALHTSISSALRHLQVQLASFQPLIQNSLNMQGQRITNLGDPTNARDAVNRSYLEQQLARLDLANRNAARTVLGTTTVVTTQAVQITY